MFYEIERSIVVLKPKTGFLNWLNSSLDLSDDNQLSLETIRIDCNSYLIPEIEEIEEGISFIDDNFEQFFQIELSAWCEDNTRWPELSLKLFWEWFEVEVSPTLIDLSEEELADEDDDELDDSKDNTLH